MHTLSLSLSLCLSLYYKMLCIGIRVGSLKTPPFKHPFAGLSAATTASMGESEYLTSICIACPQAGRRPPPSASAPLEHRANHGLRHDCRPRPARRQGIRLRRPGQRRLRVEGWGGPAVGGVWWEAGARPPLASLGWTKGQIASIRRHAPCSGIVTV